MRQKGVIHHLGHENHGLKMKSYELMHQIAFLQKQIAIMQKTYHTHYTNHANTVAHLQHKNAELNKALVIVKEPLTLPSPALAPAAQKSLKFYSWDRDYWRRHHHHHHHRNVDDGFYDNGDHLLDEDDSLGSVDKTEDHVPLLPIPQHQYSIVSVHAPTNEMKSIEMDHPAHPPHIPPQEPPHPIYPPYIPPPGPLPPTPPPPIPPTTMQSYIPQKKRMSLVL